MSDNINYLKTLSCYSRVSILKKIKDKRLNLTDLSLELKLRKSTVHEHVQKLIKSGFVAQTKNSPKSKWVFYELTDEGKALFDKEKTTFVSGMIFSGLMFIGALYFAAINFFKEATFGASQTMESAAIGEIGAKAASGHETVKSSMLDQILTHDIFLMLSAIMLLVGFAVILYLFLYKRKK